MQTVMLILSILVLTVMLFLIFLVHNTQRQNEAVREEVNAQLKEVNRQLMQATGQIGDRLDGASQMIGAVHKGLGELSQASQQIYDIGKDISSLQDILKPPKLRGVLGEVFLKELLRQVVPSYCEFQYRFLSGEMVDAVIRVGDRLVPIDSKFPLENFRKIIDAKDEDQRNRHEKNFAIDVKKHITDIAKKYIRPDEGTYDFALMYVPAENIYYEIIARDSTEDLSAFALDKRVIIVSPGTMYAYLQVIHLGLRGLQVEKHAEEIMGHLARLRGDLGRFTEDYEVLGGHINSASKKYDEAGKRLGRLSDKLALTQDISRAELPSEDP